MRAVLTTLCRGAILDARYCDHPLAGEYKGYRDCHVRNDLVLIYKRDPDVLKLVRLGTHSDLF
ncbi:type II toxin-antitoxin system mRNA interferase toxin, RelE/StbE family [Streptomyces cavourensis]|nr:type II toxin-antitoxin system mRNA interferase toxin, RelE/StbE family [Streptomyces cavourensis]